MRRRQFLHHAAQAALALPAFSYTGRLLATPADTPRLLLVFLRGGYDCNHLLIPHSSDFYYQARPTLAIARPDPANPLSALPLDGDWGLHPALRDSLYPLWQRKQLAFVPFTGTDDLSRSHFETQDNVEAGTHKGPGGAYPSGFLARLAATAKPKAPIAFTDALPLSFRGARDDIPNLSLRGTTKAAFNPQQADILAGMYRDSPLASAAADGLALRQHIADQFAQEMAQANRGAATAHRFAIETTRIASLMRSQYGLGFVDVGGWDTHVNQGNAHGQLADNLANLGQGLSAFASAMGDDWQRTVVVVVSEFGRTFRENGDQGTDHGHGTVYWVLGGSVRGGRIAGEQVAITQANLLQNRDYPVLTNYRDLLGGIFQRSWGLSRAQTQSIFPASKAVDLQLI